MKKYRCPWFKTPNAGSELETYHDTEWGVPVHDDQKHFEFLILEGVRRVLILGDDSQKKRRLSDSICKF